MRPMNAAAPRSSLLLVALLALSGPVAWAIGRPASSTATGAVDPLRCTGYGQHRVFLESQSWWSDEGKPFGGASEHAHSATCFPYGQTISGIVRFDVVSHLHNVRGARLEWVRVQAASRAYGVDTIARANPKHVCATNDCTFVTPLFADTRRLPVDGLTEFRIHTEVRGAEREPWRNLATNGWTARVENGKDDRGAPQAVPFPETEGRGWYREENDGESHGYENARFLDPLPTAPVSGVWTPAVRTLDGAGGADVVRSFAHVDPRFHAIPEDRGWIVLDHPGEFRGRLSIDTRRLTNGPHRLVLRADADVSSGRLAGLLVVPFVVDNAAGRPAPAPAPTPPAAKPTPPAAKPTPPRGRTVRLTSPRLRTVVSGSIKLDAVAPEASCVQYLVDGRKVAEDCTRANGWDERWSTRRVRNGRHVAVARANVSGRSRAVVFHVRN